jgi:hypothetical protein
VQCAPLRAVVAGEANVALRLDADPTGAEHLGSMAAGEPFSQERTVFNRPTFHHDVPSPLVTCVIVVREFFGTDEENL